jgi:hypothetical protein
MMEFVAAPVRQRKAAVTVANAGEVCGQIGQMVATGSTTSPSRWMWPGTAIMPAVLIMPAGVRRATALLPGWHRRSRPRS